MNKQIAWTALAGLFFFSSCFEISEEFTVSDSGSGEYLMKIDMYRMIEMISSLDTEKKLEDEKEFDVLQDTTMYFKDFVDESDKLNKEEKALFRDASMHMKMMLKERDFFFSFRFPFRNADDLGRLYNMAPKALSNMDYSALNKNNGTEKDGSMKAEPSGDMAASNPYFEVTSGRGFFEKKLRMDEWKAHLERDSSAIKLTELMEGTYMTTVLHLPRPATKCDHPYASFSFDKKTVTFRFPFSDYLQKPELLSFRVEY